MSPSREKGPYSPHPWNHSTCNHVHNRRRSFRARRERR